MTEEAAPVTRTTFHNVEKLPALFAALAKAQAAYAPIARDKEVRQKLKNKNTGEYTGAEIVFFYAELSSILAAVTPALSANGLAFIQPLDQESPDGSTWIVNILAHAEGGMIVTRVQVPGAQDIKGFGSNITYLRRYSAGPMLGVSSEDDADNHDRDDEPPARGYTNPPPAQPRSRSQAPAPKAPPVGKSAETVGVINAGQVKYLQGKVKALEMDDAMVAAMLGRHGASALDTKLTLAQFTAIKAELDKAMSSNA